jgi:alpha-tubulin suppressor-like RCC1 family protein
MTHLKSLLVVFLLITINSMAQVGIGTTTPHESAILEISSANKGFLPPRMTSAQRDAIVDPHIGLLIYNLTSKCLEFYTGASGNIATDWVNMCVGSGGGTPGNDGFEPPASVDTIADGFGTGFLSTRACFDIAESNDNVNGSLPLSFRVDMRANFNDSIIRNQKLTFTAEDTVSNVRFYFEDQNGNLIEDFTVDSNYSGNNITKATATVQYFSNISSTDPDNAPFNGLAHGLTSQNNLKATFYAVYNDKKDGSGTDKKIKIQVRIKDSECGGFSPTNGNFMHLISDNNEVYFIGRGSKTTGDKNFSPNNHNLRKLSFPVPMRSIFSGQECVQGIDINGNVWSWGNTVKLPHSNAGIGAEHFVLPNGVKAIKGDLNYSSYGSAYVLGDDQKLYGLGTTLGDNIGHTNMINPLAITPGINIIDFSCTAYQMFAIGSDDKIYTTGFNFNGSYGIGAGLIDSMILFSNPPTNIKPLKIEALRKGLMIIGDDGNLYVMSTFCDYGYCGTASNTELTTLTQVPKPAGMGIPIQMYHTGDLNDALFIIDDQQKLWVIGYGNFAEYGLGGIVNPAPNQFTEVPLPSGVKPLYLHTHEKVTFLISTEGKLYSAGIQNYNYDLNILNNNVPNGSSISNFTLCNHPSQDLSQIRFVPN